MQPVEIRLTAPRIQEMAVGVILKAIRESNAKRRMATQLESERGKFMAFDPKKAAEAWKKAKPVTLTKTGVSEALRALPAKPSQKQLEEYVKALAKIATALANPKVKAEKKAEAALKIIHDDLKGYLTAVQQERFHAMTTLKKMHAAATLYHAEVTKGPATEALIASWHVKFGTASREWDSRVGHEVVPEAQATKVQTTADGLAEVVNIMKNLAADAAKPQPKFNLQAELPKQLAALKHRIDVLPVLANEIASLKP